jgi:hypothetical protein
MERPINLNRRTFVAGSLGLVAAVAMPRLSHAAEATPEAGVLPAFTITLTDTGFDFPQPLVAGRYQVTVSNIGTSTDSHFALGKIPDAITAEEYRTWLDGQGEETDVLSFEKIDFVGVPDWPKPGGAVSGVIDLVPGMYFLFDPFDARGFQTIMIDGAFAAVAEPVADLTVTLKEMEIDLPDAAFTTKPMRWKIENTGAMSHEVAIVPVAPDFTEDVLQLYFSLGEEGTPPAGTPAFDYKPDAAIGILAGQRISWLDVKLTPGHYLAACMLPFSTGYPHAVDGMYRFFEVM